MNNYNSKMVRQAEYQMLHFMLKQPPACVEAREVYLNVECIQSSFIVVCCRAEVGGDQVDSLISELNQVKF